jgi:hypothetical protein
MKQLLFLALSCASFGLPLAAQFQPQTLVSERFIAAAMCYDEARQRLVVLSPTGSLWEHDGAVWARSAVSLPNAGAVRMVYDAARQRVVLVGSQVHTYDGHALAVVGTAPPLVRVVADRRRGALVGLRPMPQVAQAGIRIEELQGGQFVQVASIPGFRVTLSAAFDVQRGVTWIQVNAITSSGATQELWSWDGNALQGPFSDGIDRGSLAYDPVQAAVVAINGPVQWRWDGSQWASITVANASLAGGLLATDHRNGRIFSYSSSSAGIWDGVNWSTLPVMLQPNASSRSLVYDAQRQRPMLFGDVPPAAGSSDRRGHFEWNGTDWVRLVIPAVAPPTFAGSSVVYDAARNEIFVFGGWNPGGVTGETWVLRGTSWQQLAASGPSSRTDAAITLDSGRGRVVLLGGSSIAFRYSALLDHWEWDGSTWSLVDANIPMQNETALGYDPVRNVLVAQTLDGTTYERSAASWQMVGTNGPRAVSYAGNSQRQLLWNPTIQQLEGSFLAPSAGSLSTFAYDGTTWRATSSPPGLRAFDVNRGTALMYNGAITLLESSVPASIAYFGSGCGGSLTSSSLSPFRAPRLGEASFHLDLRVDATLRPAFIGLALNRANVPLGQGCEFLLQDAVTTSLWFTDAAGFLRQRLPIPSLNALRGVILHAQGAVLDPASPLGLAMTQGLSLQCGD